jgi:hypothetical protein
MYKRIFEHKLSVLFILMWIGLLVTGSPVYSQYEYGDEAVGPGVFLYKHADFRGSRIFVPAGKNIRNLHHEGWNDKISSIELVDGARLVIFEHKNYQGAWTKIKRDVVDLAEFFSGINGNWNDKISSIKVINRRGYGNNDYYDDEDDYEDDVYCIFYKHSNRRGKSFEGRLGKHKKIKRKWNDEISSVWVRGGCELVIFEHSHFGGRQLLLRGKGRIGSTYNLAGFRFNDQASSYILKKRRGFRDNWRKK